MSLLVKSLKTLRESGSKVKDVTVGFQFLHKYGNYLYEARTVSTHVDPGDNKDVFMVRYKGFPKSEDAPYDPNEILDQGYPHTTKNAKIAAEEVATASKRGSSKGGRTSNASQSSSRKSTAASLSTSRTPKGKTPKQEKVITPSNVNTTPARIKSQSRKKESFFPSASTSPVKRPEKAMLASNKTKAEPAEVKPKEDDIMAQAQKFHKDMAALKNKSLDFPPNLISIYGFEAFFPAIVTIDEAMDEYIHALKCGRPNPHPIHKLEMVIEEIEALRAEIDEHLPIYCTKEEFLEYLKQLDLKRAAKHLEPLNLDDFLESDKENDEPIFKKLRKVHLPMTDVFDVLFLVRFLKDFNAKRNGNNKYIFAFYRPMWNDMLKFIGESVVKDQYEEGEMEA